MSSEAPKKLFKYYLDQ